MTHILLIGAEDYYERTLAARLRTEGYMVSLRSNEADALALVQREQPDVVLLTMAPAGLDALTLCRHIRALSAVPIICLSATHEEDSVVRALEAGADIYLQQPISLVELSARVKAGLRRPGFRALEGARAHEHALSPSLGEDHGAAR